MWRTCRAVGAVVRTVAGLVRAEEPEDGDGGSEALADAVASLDGDAAVVAEGVEDFFLLAPEVDAQKVAGEADGVAPEGVAEGLGGAVVGGGMGVMGTEWLGEGWDYIHSRTFSTSSMKLAALGPAGLGCCCRWLKVPGL